MKLCKEISWRIRTQPEISTMENVSLENNRNSGMAQVHVEPPPTPLIKVKYDGKSDKDFVKLKLRRDTTSS